MATTSLRKRIWGWFFFDWAAQPYHTLLVTFVFAPYFTRVAMDAAIALGATDDAAKAQAQSMWSLGLTLSGLTIAFGAPLIGALADTTGRRRPWIIGFSVLYVLGSFNLWWLTPDGHGLWMALIWFGIGFIGTEYAQIFINAQLPSLGTKEEIGRLSGSGFAFGYVGGLVALAISLLFFTEQATGKTLIGLTPAFGLDAATNQGTRFVGPMVALWFVIFMIPYFLWVPDQRAPKKRGGVKAALSLLKQSVSRLRVRKSLSAYLVSSMLYRDALNSLYSFGGVYAGLVLEWKIVTVGIFGVISGVAAALFCLFGGQLDQRFGPRPVIITSILGLLAVCTTLVGMNRTQIFGIPFAEGSNLPDIIFFGCGILIGGFGGVLQSSSRSLMARHTDPAAPTESFGLYGLSGRATAFLAPMLIGIVTTLTASPRIGFSPVLVLFVLGLFLLRWVSAEGDQETWISESKV